MYGHLCACRDDFLEWTAKQAGRDDHTLQSAWRAGESRQATTATATTAGDRTGQSAEPKPLAIAALSPQ